jgi:trk system potassium uptake protein TrkA
VRSEFGVSVVGIHDTRTDEMHTPPDPDEPLKRTDTLLLAGPDEALSGLAEIASETAEDSP